MENGRNAFFFTHEMNVSFVENEIRNLSGYFKKVTVYTFKKEREYELPENVSVVVGDYTGYSTSARTANW